MGKKIRIMIIIAIIIIITMVFYNNYYVDKNNVTTANMVNNNEDFNEFIDNENDTNNEEVTVEENKNIQNAKFNLKNQYDNNVNLQDYREKKVILFFWQIWCPACVEELEEINELYKELGNNEKDVILLSLTKPKIEGEQEKKQEKDKKIDEIIDYINGENYKFPVLFDEERTVFNEFGITSYPTTIILDEEGNESYRKVMQKISKEEIIVLLD